jgi:predicted  nucleic acid-binding Zn-ribbon protein
MSSTEEIKDAAYKLTLAVVNFSDRIEGMQKRIEGINEELPSADAASNRLQQLLNEIDFAKTESAASSNALRTLTEQLKNAVGSYIAEMDDAQVRLDAAATYLESVASTISESSSSTPDPSNNSTVSPEAPENDEKGE